MRDAFNILADEDGTIEMFNIISQIETNHIKDKETPLIVHILKRLYNFSEVWGDPKVNFD